MFEKPPDVCIVDISFSVFLICVKLFELIVVLPFEPSFLCSDVCCFFFAFCWFCECCLASIALSWLSTVTWSSCFWR